MIVRTAAKRAVNASFELATAGWVLGPLGERNYLDTVLPEEFREIDVDPIFPVDAAANHDISFDDSKGGFSKTVFPSKRPVKRSEVTKLRETLEKMLVRMEEEEAEKARIREQAGIEADAHMEMLGDSEADIQAKAQRRVKKDTEAKAQPLNAHKQMRDQVYIQDARLPCMKFSS